LERVHAIKINDYQALEKAGINRKAVARCVVESYLKQVLEDGFFHADPHPGNLFVTQGAEGPVVTYVDFGMVGEVTPPMKQAFREAMIAIGQRDVDKLVDALRVLGFLRPGANVQAVKKAIQWLFDNYRAVSAQTLNFKQIEELHEDILQILRDQPLMVPAQFAFLGKTVGSMIGLATGLDPEFDIIEVTKPYVQKMISQATKDWPNLILNEVKSWAQMATQVPRQLNQVLELASKGQLTVNLKTEARATAQRQEAKLWPVTIFSLLLAGGGFYLLVNQGLKTEGLLLLFLGIGTFWYNLR
jgi:predicted unusual protein kinase regulating ubiquinone biosynthesis (AarF/ABC1/UbiB family)